MASDIILKLEQIQQYLLDIISKIQGGYPQYTVIFFPLPFIVVQISFTLTELSHLLRDFDFYVLRDCSWSQEHFVFHWYLPSITQFLKLKITSLTQNS